MKKIALSAFVIAASGAYVWSQAGTPDPLLDGIGSADIETGSIAPPALRSAGGMDVAPREAPVVTDGKALPANETVSAPADTPADTQPLPPLPATPGDSVVPAIASPPPVSPAPATTPVGTAATVTVPMPLPRPPYHRVAAAAPTPAAASARSFPVAPVVRIAASASGFNDGTYAGPVVDAYYGLMQIEAVISNGRLATIHVLQYPNDRRTSIFINRQALPMLRDEVISAQSASVDIVSGATLSSEAFLQSLGAALDKARA